MLVCIKGCMRYNPVYYIACGGRIYLIMLACIKGCRIYNPVYYIACGGRIYLINACLL